MKILISIGVSLALCAAAAQAAASSPATPTNAVPNFPSPDDLQPLERWYHQGGNYSVPPAPADGSWTHPGERVGTLGFVSSRYFEGSITLFSCVSRGSPNRFTSHDHNCEGQIPAAYLPILGYVSSHQYPGMTPLFRCRTVSPSGKWVDHFDSPDARCEGAAGAVNEGVLGYMWQSADGVTERHLAEVPFLL